MVVGHEVITNVDGEIKQQEMGSQLRVKAFYSYLRLMSFTDSNQYPDLYNHRLYLIFI